MATPAKATRKAVPGFGSGQKVGRMTNPRRLTEEIGSTGLAQYGGYIVEDFEKQLQGQRGLQKLRELAFSNPICAASIFAYRNMLMAPKLRVEPAGEKPGDLAAAQHLEECMGDMAHTFQSFRGESSWYVLYGFAWHEMVMKRREGKQPETYVSTSDGSFKLVGKPSSRYDDGRIGWAKFAPRSQEAVSRWGLTEEGDLVGMFHAPAPRYQETFLPLAKSLHFVTNQRCGNPEGISILRSGYRSSRLSKNIEDAEAIGVARNLNGYPVLQPPDGIDLFDEADPVMLALLKDAKDLVTGIKRDEQQGAVLPFGWTLQLLAANGSEINTNAIVDRYHTRIAMAMLTQFIMLGMERGGAYELAKQQQSMWLRAVKGYLLGDLEVLNNRGVPLLIDLNDFGELSGYPRVEAEDITEPELVQIADYASKLAHEGLLTGSPGTEEHFRERGSLPDLEEEFQVEAPSNEPPPTEPAASGGAPEFEKDQHYSIHDVLVKEHPHDVRELVEEDLKRKGEES